MNYDIAVEGTSFPEVMANLREAVTDYLEYVETLPEPDRTRLLNRRVPLLVRLKFIYWWVMDMFFNKPPDHFQRAEFTLTCPA